MDFDYSEEQKEIIRNVKEVSEEFRDVFYKANQGNERYSAEDGERLRQTCDRRGLLGMVVPREWGGQERSFLDYLIGVEHATRYGPGMYLSYLMTYTANGEVMQILTHGTEEAKQKYLRDIVKYKKVLGLALAEPGAGSALTDIATTAKLESDHYVLNGVKRWAGYGGEAGVYYTLVREPGTVGARGIFVLLVDKDSPSISYGKDWGFWGVYQGLRHDIIFKNCRVPRENLLVKPGQFGEMMSAFNTFRLQNAARTLGMGEGALDVAIKWSQKRRQFGKLLCDFEMIQGRLADMVMELEAAKLLLYKAASRGIGEKAPALDTSIAKEYCNQAAVRVCDSACHILGAYGFVRESDTEWRYRQARVLAIATGTSEMQKVRIVSELLGRQFNQRLNTFNPELFKMPPEPEL
ncbi:MAG: acyl-CoA/acyl-ACP dehydrogenase [Chloroflexi bacterium]|nr:acyl-CoA/acyl-ACP dehydrogenase [Chloroflexota bacterium]